MGAVLSLPATVAANGLAACLGASCCSCLSSPTLNPLARTFKSSVATRVMYAIIFCLNSTLSWFSMSDSFISMQNKFAYGPFNSASKYCRENGCQAFTNVQRINFSLGMWHLMLAGLLVGVTSTKNPRAAVQNGYWVAKILVLWLFIAINFMIPDGFFIVWGNYFSIIFGTLFILIGLILLVDFAHEWAETCLEKIDEGEIYLEGADDYEGGSFCSCIHSAAFWRTMLVGGTVCMYVGVILMTVLMYHYFSHSGCGMNTAFITINLLMALGATALSIAPVVQEYNPNAGLAQGSMCCVYCTYLVFSACLSEPDDKKCNPLIRSAGTRKMTTILGALFTFVAIAYTTTRAAANSAFSHDESNPNYQGTNGGSVMDVVSQQPQSKNEMRMEAIRQAVQEGSLPESALTDPDYLDEPTGGDDDETSSTKYNYVVFHVIFFLATQYIAALLTVNVDVQSGEGGKGGFVPVGRTYFNTWLKVISSWVCYGLYSATLLSPVLFPERFM